jgi:cell fate (sporulation/competence/biofilm development) regulator YlbF (YheA/YmcA/DUF963 family)
MTTALYDSIVAESARISAMIADSDVYKRYLYLKDMVTNDTALYEKINEYKRLNMEYREKCGHGGFFHFDTEKYISNLYWELMLNDAAADFLRYESEIAQVITGAVTEITKGCPLEL